jgi:hypothetical protein
MESLRRLRTVTQSGAHNSTCLKYFRDVRCTREETWAIEEGSLVISINPTYVDLPQRVIAPDEFELRAGEVFVVCLMFADMWALCARHRLSSSIASLMRGSTALQTSNNFKFLPLCFVTLAANYGSFERRCAKYRKRFPFSGLFPSGGNRIQPPERKESLEASRKIFKGSANHLPALPKMVYEVCKAPVKLPAATDYVPFDAPADNTQATTTSKDVAGGHATIKRLFGKLTLREDGTKKETASDGEQDNNPAEEQDSTGESSAEGQGPSDPNKTKMRKRKSILNFFWSSKSQSTEEAT